MNPSSHSHYSVVLELPARQVWAVVRDFNSYPIWVDGVDESHIEEDLSGTAVGGVRNFAMGGFRTRQRLLAHSDVDRFFTYDGCDPVEIEADGSARTLIHYEGTLRIWSIVEGDRSLAEWSARYQCPPQDAGYWVGWWAQSIPTWLSSLRNHLDRRHGVLDLDNLPEG